MNKAFVAVLMLGFAAAPAIAADFPPADASAAAAAHAGKMLVSADGARLASISSVGSDGPQIIMDGRIVTVPANTLKVVDGKLTTTLTKSQVISLP